MNTKNYYSLVFLLSLLAIPFISYSQQNECATVFPEKYQSNREKSPKAYKKFLKDFKARAENHSSGGSCINYAPIKAHVLRHDDGTGGLTETELNDAIDNMNTIYESACLAFYLCDGINYIDDDTYYDFDQSQESALTGANNVANLINIYFCNSVSDGPSSYCGYAYYPGNQDVILMDNSCTMNGSTLAHEVGHFFSLPHTHSGGDELVDGTNCTTAGDEFCDTEADPQLSYSTVNSSCVYTGTETDANGANYNPNTHNIMSYSRKPCRDFFSVEQFAAISYTFLNVRNYWACAGFDVDFSVDANQSCTTPFTVNFTEEADGETTYEWDFENDGTIDDTTPNPSHTYTSQGFFDVCLTISDGTNTISKVKTAYINTSASLAPFETDLENFNTATNATGYQDNWTTSPEATTSSYRWNLDTGGTPSPDTGPSIDHTLGTGTGIYAFSEATSGNPGDIAELFSPCLEISPGATNATVSFWYHMYGSSMGTLHIDLHNGSSWINDFSTAIAGQQQSSSAEAFQERTFNVGAYAGQVIQIRFRAERGTSFRSDMAIDDFLFSEDGPLPVELTNFEGQIIEQGQHLLTWQTLSERNSDYFLIEHSLDGQSFSSIGENNAIGNSDARHDYQFLNDNPKNGSNYYRLKMVDLDETFEYSKVIVLNHQEIAQEIAIYPNPGRGQYQIDTPTTTENLDYIVYNAIGQIVTNGSWTSGANTYTLDLRQFDHGIYTIQIKSQEKVLVTEKLIKY